MFLRQWYTQKHRKKATECYNKQGGFDKKLWNMHVLCILIEIKSSVKFKRVPVRYI